MLDDMISYDTQEEADIAANIVQWASPVFDEVRNVSEEVYNIRKDLCEACEYIDSDNCCTQCQCFLPEKTRSKYEKCPEAKWNKLEDRPIEAAAVEDDSNSMSAWAEKRAYEYPSLQEQADMAYWDRQNGTTTLDDAIAAVKLKFPKQQETDNG
jgi:hypothetical protein